MKNPFMVGALFVSMLTASCSSTMTEEIDSLKGNETANLTFSVLGDEFQSSFTRADASEVLKKLDLALFTEKDGVYTPFASAQSEVSDENFGTFSISNVPYGTYTVVSIGNASNSGGHADLTNPLQISFEDGVIPVTYYVCQAITVNASVDNIVLTLKPAVATFKLAMNGAVPSNASKLRFEVQNISNYFNAITGLASVDKIGDWSTDISFPASYIGQQGKTARINMFLSAEDLSTNSDVNIKATAFTAENDVIVSYDLVNVPLRRGFVTTYTGNFFQNDAQGFEIVVDNTWGELTGSY